MFFADGSVFLGLLPQEASVERLLAAAFLRPFIRKELYVNACFFHSTAKEDTTKLQTEYGGIQ